MTNWGPIGQEVYERTYSRKMEDGTDEDWHDTVRRVVAGNISLAPSNKKGNTVLERISLQESIEAFDIIPAGRHLWVSGVRGRHFTNNCFRAGFTKSLAEHFCFMFDELMKGGGVGSNYSEEYVSQAKLTDGAKPVKLWIHCVPEHPNVDEVNPDPSPPSYTGSKGKVGTFLVDDSREGWVGALKALLDVHQNYEREGITINLSKVRSRGTAIKGFGGTASGPGPLADMLRSVNDVIVNRTSSDRLSWSEAMMIDHHIARCVISGNVRRSARMSIMHWNDDAIFDFINCKQDTGEHWTTNISVELDKDWFDFGQHTMRGLDLKAAVSKSAYANGEPGLYNSFAASEGENGDVRSSNPCGEIALEDWEPCNLGHVNLAQMEDSDGDVRYLNDCLRLMTRFLIRATFADTTDKTKEVVDRNRRIGVGLFGFQEWCINRFGVKYSDAGGDLRIEQELLRMQAIVRNEAVLYSEQLGIPEPIKVTTIAPTGTIAKLPGVSEGIHPIYAKYFIRRVRYANDDPALVKFVTDPEITTEPCRYSENTTVVNFICEDEIFLNVDENRHYLVESVEDIGIEDMLAVQRMVQEFWSDNAVSFTVNFNPDKLDPGRLHSALWDNIEYLKGTTVMPDGSRPQAPYERLTKSEYQTLAKTGKKNFAASSDECASGACPVK